MKSFESRLTIFLSYSFIQRARAGALVLVSLQERFVERLLDKLGTTKILVP